ncbi:MAG: thiamine phosphate synthase [Dehalococcoidia bacterium]
MPEDASVIAAMLYRLAHACQEHLQDSTLASRLRTMAAGETSSFSAHQHPSLSEATALAGAVNRFLSAGNGVVVGPDTPPNLPALRDLAQEVESALAAGIRREAASRVAGLYVIVDPELTRGRDVEEVARAALRGGATAIQLRDKVRDKGVQLPVARRLFKACQEFDASFIINDHADLAVACGAHGLHVGQTDLPALEARSVLYPAQFLGTSNALVKEAQVSLQQRVDYIAVGAVYNTDSKGTTRPAGIQGLRRVKEQVSAVPIVAIGGINGDNVGPVLEAGADGICVIGAVCLADDPEKAARHLVERIQAHRASAPLST